MTLVLEFYESSVESIQKCVHAIYSNHKSYKMSRDARKPVFGVSDQV